MDQATSNQQAGANGPNPDYEARPVAMQYRPGPNVHSTLEEIAIAYTNHLEEQVNTLRYAFEDQLNTRDHVRAKNTELEVINRGLRADLAGAVKMAQGNLARALAAEERLNSLLTLPATAPSKLEHVFLAPDYNDLGINQFVGETRRWSVDTFGPGVTSAAHAMALVEEAIEVAQVLGISEGQIKQRTEQVYMKPTGLLRQELGGVAVTWAAVVASTDHSPSDVLVSAIQDCWNRQDEIRRKKGYVAAAGHGKAVPGALERLAAEGVTLTFTNEQKPYGNASEATIAEANVNLAKHVEATRQRSSSEE